MLAGNSIGGMVGTCSVSSGIALVWHTSISQSVNTGKMLMKSKPSFQQDKNGLTKKKKCISIMQKVKRVTNEKL